MAPADTTTTSAVRVRRSPSRSISTPLTRPPPPSVRRRVTWARVSRLTLGMRQRRIDADHLRVGFRLHQAWEAVAGVAADAPAAVRIGLVAHDADRHRERPVAEPAQVVDQLLDARLVAERRMQVGRTGARLGRVGAALAVHLVQMLGARVVGLELAVLDRPGRGDAAVVARPRRSRARACGSARRRRTWCCRRRSSGRRHGTRRRSCPARPR